jgi:hypothetical protein
VNIEPSSAHVITKIVFLIFGAPAEWTEDRIDDVVSTELFRLIVAALRADVDDEDPR